MVCYAEKQEKPFWFSSLDQIVHFGPIIFCRTFKNYFGQFVWIEKKKKRKVTIIVAFHFMKRRLKRENKKKQEGRSERIENRYEQKVNKNGKVGKVNDALVSNELCLFFFIVRKKGKRRGCTLLYDVIFDYVIVSRVSDL